MVTMLEECNNEEQHYSVLQGQNNSMQRTLIGKYFLFMGTSVCNMKRFTANILLMKEKLKLMCRIS
jgi:hypothetical protein